MLFIKSINAQNSMVGDGFGGRLWYQPTNYTAGSYAAYSICYSGNCQNGINQLYGWGHNGSGELGLGPTVLGVNNPTPIPNMTDVKYYSTGYVMGAIKNDNSGWVWGVGLSSAPVQVISNITFLDASSNTVGFVKNDGSVWSVGYNNNGNFGNGSTYSVTSITSPSQMLNITNAVRVANNSFVTAVLLSDGTVKAVGTNTYGLLGIGNSSITQTLTACNVSGLTNIVDIKANVRGLIALDSNGDVYTWGIGSCIGDGDLSDENSPKKITTLSNIIAISGCDDGDHFMALDANKNCYAWGSNSYSQIGNGNNNVYQLIPTLVATNVIDIMAGERFSYIVKQDGTLWCSGKSNTGGSIWLNLADQQRNSFTELNPALVQGACPVNTSILNITQACSNNNGVISIDKIGGQAPYLYDIGNGNQTSSIFTGLTSGDYTITITDVNLCVTTITCAVPNGIGNIPTISVNSSSICSGESLTLSASGATNYIWQQSNGLSSTIGTSVIASPNVTTIYTVTGTNNNGCASNNTSTVTVMQSPSITTSKDTICIGGSTELITIGANSYTWTPFNSLNTNNTSSVIATPSVNTIYTVQSNNGICTFTTTQQIVVETNFPSADYSGITTQSSIIGSNLELNNLSTNFTSVKWYLCDNTISTNNITSFMLQEAGNCCIKLIAYNNNCKDSITKCINVTEEIYIKIPNVFSPNGDGINDFFKINTKGIKSLHCEIYNRWGQKLYEWTDLNSFWDGKTKAGAAPAGTYFYIVNYSDNEDNSKTEKGFLTLFRE
ncbi:MAG: gliding motility-associated C-terminal domain-containing protein [Bacteroidia bacterium]|nr:gliding motility-associated C-terminal domain-containing protein [Bacteroidia bacterium]